MLIGNICENDRISFAETIDDLVYPLTTPATQFSDSFLIVQDYPECPVQCQLFMSDGNLQSYGITPTNQPILEIETADKSFNGVTITLAFACRSTLSIGPDGDAPVVLDGVQVTFEDECLNS